MVREIIVIPPVPISSPKSKRSLYFQAIFYHNEPHLVLAQRFQATFVYQMASFTCIFASLQHLSKKRNSVIQEESLKIWFRRLKSGFGLKTHHSSFPRCHKNRGYTQGSLAKCDKILALLMASQVPNCPPTAGLLVKYVRESSLERKPNENFLFSFQNKACRESWVSKTDSNVTKPACGKNFRPHTWLPESERERQERWQVSFRALISGEQRTEAENSLPISVSSSKRARAHARHDR